MKNYEKMFQTKEQDTSLEPDPNEMDMYDLSDREFQITIIKDAHQGLQSNAWIKQEFQQW